MSSATAKTDSTIVSISSIIFDSETQSRVTIDYEKVGEYQAAIKDGDQFPPITVFFDGESYWIGDGFHRAMAYRAAGLNEVPAIVHPGGKRDAILHAVGANATHGMPRSNEDKRRSVKTMLDDEEWATWTDTLIAKQCSVSINFVGKLRPISDPSLNGSMMRPRKTSTGRTINTANIGKRAKSSPKTEPAPAVNGEANGHPKGLEPKSPEPQVEPEASEELGVAEIIDRARAKAEDDREWLEGLRRREGEPTVREQLPQRKRAKFDEDALIYRGMHTAGFWQSFANLAVQLTGDKKTGGAKGANYARLLSWFRRLDHPKDWVLCPACQGTGLSNGRACPAKNCNQNGYIVEANG